MGRLIFLGTGDSLNPERAQTSLAVLLPGDEVMLVDASSGTVLLGRLEACGIPLESVRHLFVSHRHFDHVGGLAPLLTALAALPEAFLTVHAAPETLRALRGVLELTLPGAEGWLGKRLGWHELLPNEPTELGGTDITPFLMNHGIECLGFRTYTRHGAFDGDRGRSSGPRGRREAPHPHPSPRQPLRRPRRVGSRG